jgi:hypothetical protein
VDTCLRRILKCYADTPLNPRWFIHRRWWTGLLPALRLRGLAIRYQGWVQSSLTCDEMCSELRALTECRRDSRHPVIVEVISCYDMLPAETQAITYPSRASSARSASS